MNSKKVNWVFLCLILLNLALYALMFICYAKGIALFDIGIVTNLLISQLIILSPAFLFMLASGKKTETGRLNEMLGFQKIKVSSFFMVLLFTFLIMPMSTALNAISMLFVEYGERYQRGCPADAVPGHVVHDRNLWPFL